MTVMRSAARRPTDSVPERWSSCCGVPVCGSLRHWRSLRVTSTAIAAPCSSVAARAASAARSARTHWAWEQIDPWLRVGVQLRIGALLRVIDGATQGRPWSAAVARATLRQLAVRAGVRRRLAPHQLRHAHAVEMAREGVPLNVIQRQLGHANLGITSIYLQGIDNSEIIETIHRRAAPMLPASSGLR